MKYMVVLLSCTLFIASSLFAQASQPTASLKCGLVNTKALGKVIKKYAEDGIKADCPACQNVAVKVKITKPGKILGTANYSELLAGSAVTITASGNNNNNNNGGSSAPAALEAPGAGGSNNTGATAYTKGAALAGGAAALAKTCQATQVKVKITSKYVDPTGDKQKIIKDSTITLPGILM